MSDVGKMEGFSRWWLHLFGMSVEGGSYLFINSVGVVSNGCLSRVSLFVPCDVSFWCSAYCGMDYAAGFSKEVYGVGVCYLLCAFVAF